MECIDALHHRLRLEDYKATGSVCGYKLPEACWSPPASNSRCSPRPPKRNSGEHDENISTARAAEILGARSPVRSRTSPGLFKEGRAWAKAGIIIADTKFEFGMVDGELILIDEVLTPDSSRFWPAEGYKAGRAGRASFDKQYLRDWLSGQPWTRPRRRPPAKEVVEATRTNISKPTALTGSELALNIK